MSQDPQFGAGLWVFGQFMDRYVGAAAYGPPIGTLEAIDRAGKVGGLVGLDFMFPWAEQDLSVKQVMEALERNNLKCWAISPPVFTSEYMFGSFTSTDPKVRQKAIDACKFSTEVAHEMGAKYVKLWPGQDGFDYPLQVNPAKIWNYSVEGVRKVAESDPTMQYAIEYKSKEPRVYMNFGNAARTLLGIHEMGVDNVGIVMDLGHSLLAKEAPADALHLVHKHGKLTSIELNDNWRDWDDDMVVGSVHLMETIEFVLAIKRIGWDQPWLLDQFPFRENPVRAAQESIRTLKAINRMLDDIDMAALDVAQEQQDALRAYAIIRDVLFQNYLEG